MSRATKWVRNILIGLGVLILTVVLAAFIVIRTQWLRDYARQQIVSAIEDGTGGRVEAGQFDFDASEWRATLNNLVIHGNEPAGAAPFVRISRVEAHIRLLTSLKHLVDIASVVITQPEANIMVLANGKTNIPSPKTVSTSNGPPLKSVVDLAIGHFELNNGSVTFDSQTAPLNLKANNLRALLNWNIPAQSYQGEIALAPIYVVAGRETPVVVNVKLPLTIAEDRVDLHHAYISTAASSILIDGAVSHLQSPQFVGTVNGTVAMVDLKSAGVPLDTSGRGIPTVITLAADVSETNNVIEVKKLQTNIGKSSINASGNLHTLTFQSSFDLGELGKLFKVAAAPDGTLIANGNAAFGANNSWQATGDLHGANIAIRQGSTQIRNVDLTGHLTANNTDIELANLNLAALGGRFEGNASLKNMESYQLNGQLRSFDIHSALATLGQKLPYEGSLSGTVDAQGNTNNSASLVAQARLSIAPGRRGVPVSGRINADYTGTHGDIAIRKSYVALPHSRLDLDGDLGKVLQVSLHSQDLNDMLVAVNPQGPPPVTLNHGDASFTGTVTGSLRAPHIAGHLAATRFVIQNRQFDALAADVTAANNGAALSNGVLNRASAGPGSGLQANFSGAVGLSNWSLPPREPVKLDLTIPQGDLADLAALAGQKSLDYSGAINVSAHVTGTAGDPVGNLNLQATNGLIDGQSFDQTNVQANLTDRLVTVPAAYIQSGTGRVDLTAEFHHPADSFTTGNLHAKISSNQIDLANTIARARANMTGTVALNADVTANLTPDEILLTAVNGNITAKTVKISGQNYGDLAATARTAGQAVTWNLDSVFAGSTVRANGNTQLVHDYPTTADATIANLAIEKVLAAANQTDIPARGTLSGTAHLTGTIRDPHGDANLELTRAVLYDEPVDRLRVRATYLPRSIDIPEFQIAAGTSRIDLTAHYDHPENNLSTGNIAFNINSSNIDLASIHNVQTRRPGLAGVLHLAGKGEGTLHDTSVAAASNKDQPRLTLRDLNVNLDATSIRANGENFGDLKLAANTIAPDKVGFTLDSTLAGASIHGSGNAQLTSGYPVNAQLKFSNLLYSRISKLAGTSTTEPSRVEAALDGQMSINGPVLHTDQLNGNLELTRVTITGKTRPGESKSVTISNQGNVMVALNHGAVQIQNAHLAGGGVDIQAGGSASIPAQTLAVILNAKMGLAILPDFDSDIYSAGDVALNATVRGTLSHPMVNGLLELHNATFSYAGLPNGLSNANGTIALNGQSATIQNITGESGGGKLTLAGYASYTDIARFALHLKASGVRARLQPGVSITANADLQLSGTSRSSIISGTTTINQVSYNPQTDMASVLTRSLPSAESDSAPSPILDSMRLDVRVRTSTGLAVRADIAQGISANADLRVQGTAARPGVLGRVTIAEGKLIFLGSSYTVDSGTIAFYNPLRVDPILDVSLETQTQGIDVIVRVTGPVDNMKLSYTSNPPLQFQEIVSLLATGKTPTSDPTLLANQPQVPQSSFAQMGESAVLGQAVANPVAGRLQRVFGVSQLKIDPAFQGGSAVPTARLTLQQRITNNVTFTYTSALDDPNGQIVKVEWAFDPKWSAVATRDQNGIFSVNFFYKRQFR